MRFASMSSRISLRIPIANCAAIKRPAMTKTEKLHSNRRVLMEGFLEVNVLLVLFNAVSDTN